MTQRGGDSVARRRDIPRSDGYRRIPAEDLRQRPRRRQDARVGRSRDVGGAGVAEHVVLHHLHLLLGDLAVDDPVRAQLVLLGIAGADEHVVRERLLRQRDVGARRVRLGGGVRVVDDDGDLVVARPSPCRPSAAPWSRSGRRSATARRSPSARSARAGRSRRPGPRGCRRPRPGGPGGRARPSARRGRPGSPARRQSTEDRRTASDLSPSASSPTSPATRSASGTRAGGRRGDRRRAAARACPR